MDLISLNYFSANIKEVELWISILTFAIATFFGLMIIFNNSRSWTNRLFAWLVLVFDAYIIFNYLSLHPLDGTTQSQLFWIRMVMLSASLKAPILFLFVHTYPGEKIKLKLQYVVPVVILGATSAIMSITSGVFKSLDYVNGSPLPVPGPAMPLFFVNFVGFILLSFILLVIKYRKATDKEKSQQFYLLSGIITSFTLIGVSSLIFVVILKSATLVFLGPIFFLALIGSIGYAIVQYGLFNVKTIATQILVVTIWIILFSQVLVADSLTASLIDIAVLGFVVIFGILLIQNIKKEIKQREVLEQLTQELGVANEKLKELDHVKSEFLSFASHQVKTPLAAVKGFASLISDGTYGEVPDKVKEVADKIKDAADRTINLVNDFLNLRKIEEGKMEYKLESIDGAKLVKDISEELRPLADKKNLEFSFKSEVKEGVISVDVQRIRQVFQNLIENSIKYTDSGFVKIQVEIKDSDFLFSVSDSGHGLSKELLPHLFEEFKRGDKEKKIEGTGLGLFIAHEIVGAHKGDIWAESEGQGKGSTFFVRLPLVS